MSFEEEFDNIIRRKSEELDFPFDEKNWEKASALLDADRSALPVRSLKHYALPAVLGLIVLVSGIMMFISPEATTKPAVIAAERNAGPDQNNELINTGKSVLPEKNTTSGEKSLANKTVQSGAPAFTSSGLSSGDPGKTNAGNEIPAAPIAKDLASSSHNTTLRQNSSSSQADVSTEEAMPAHHNSVDKTNTPASGKTTASSNDQPANNNAAVTHNGITANQDHAAVNRNANNGSAGAPVSGKASSEQTAFQDQPSKNNSGEQNAPLYEPAGIVIQQDPSGVSGIEQLPFMAAPALEQAEPEIADLPLNYMKRYDEDYFKNGNKKRHFMSVELGGTYMLGWHTTVGKDGKGLDWFGGVNYGMYLTNKLSVSAGLQAYNIKNITQASYTSEKTEYNFGSITSNTTITSNNLYYAAIPVKILYQLNKTSRFGLGVNVGYLVNSKNTVETYQVQDNVKIHDNPVKNTGVYQNANSLNVMLGASYRAEVMHRLYLNTELVYGLSDIFKNTKTNTNKEQVTGVRLSLQFMLFDK